MLSSRSCSRPPPILFLLLFDSSVVSLSPSLSLSLSWILVHSRATHDQGDVAVSSRARMHGALGAATAAATTHTPMHFHAYTHARTFTQPRIEHRLRSLPEFNDPLTRPSRASPPPPEPSRLLPPPLFHLRCSLALARSPHDFLSLANFSCLFRIARSLLLTPSAFLFLHAGYISPFPLYTTSRFLRHQVPPFLSVHRFPCFSLLYSLVDSVSSCHSSFPSGLLPSRPSFPLDGRDSSTLVARRTVHCVATLVPSLLLSPSFTRTQRALGAVERERESAMSERREPETPFLAAATRNGISRTDNGPFRGLLLALAGCCCPFVPSSS